jgi:hypothetical protein
MLTINELREKGGLVSDVPVVQTITFRIGDEEMTAEIFVRRISIGDQERIFRADKMNGSDTGRVARMIAGCIRLGEQGEETLTYEDADRLHPAIAAAMVEAIKVVNNLAEAKN